MAAVDADRVEALEHQIRELQAVHAQLVAYAEDLNRTYHELRLRLQQMTSLSNVATQLACARTVDSASRICAEAARELYPRAEGRVYLVSRGGLLKLASERGVRSEPAVDALCESAAQTASASQDVVRRVGYAAGTEVEVIAVALVVRGRTFGALAVTQPSGLFKDEDARVVELLGHNTAAAIANVRLYEHTRRLAITDSVTKLYNPRHFQLSLSQEVQKARRFKYPIAVIMADIDHFKVFNDTYGHLKGNVALRTVARAMAHSLRQTDTVARYGGEEFVAILPGCDHTALAQVAEKVRESVARTPIRLGNREPPAHVTVSIGGTWQDAENADAGMLLAEADSALYMAKALGRDRVCVRP
jgi:diguanylate cyclase (GGDEF)-like protein